MSNLQIHFLGTGDAFCSGGRFQTCFHISTQAESFLIDCGATSLMALKQNGISTKDIGSILITHFHGDHYGGLPFFLIDAFYESQREEVLRIAGPPGIEQQVFGALNSLYPGIDPLEFSYPIEFTEYANQPIEVGSVGVQSYEVVHAPQSLPHAIKIQVEDKIISFSGDTGWVDNLPDIASGSDLFICESNFYETEISMHLNYKKIVDVAPELTCKRLILNHLGPEMLQNLHRVEIECAHDGLQIEV